MREYISAIITELREQKREGVECIHVLDTTFENLERAVKALGGELASARRQTSAPEQTVSRLKIDSDGGSDKKADEEAKSFKFVSTPISVTPPKTVPVQITVTATVSEQTAKPSVVVNSRILKPPTIQLPKGDKQKCYEWLKKQLAECAVCQEKIEDGKYAVIGSGNLDAPIFFCAEATSEENGNGEVIGGDAGILLHKIIQAMGFKREQIYIGNVVNWRPPTTVGSRSLTAEELAFCLPYLRAQIEIVQPKVIVALGKTAVDGLLGMDAKRKLGDVRGKWIHFQELPLMVTFHPSYLLHNNTNRTKRVVWEDMMQVMTRLEMPISDKQKGYFL